MVYRKRVLPLILFFTLTILFTITATAQTTPADEGGAVLLSGRADYTFPYFALFLPEPYVVLYDLAGLVERDPQFVPSAGSQALGVITSDPLSPPFSYELSLPAVPRGETRDVDNNGQDDTGVMIFTVVIASNSWAGPFLEERDAYSAGVVLSAQISADVDTLLDITSGQLLIYAPDDTQAFPVGFGADGRLFTDDDPSESVPRGYTVVDLDVEPFRFDRAAYPEFPLQETEDAALADFSDQTFVDAFDSMIDLLRREYAFTEYKGLDWDTLSAEFRPQVADAQRSGDEAAFRRVLRDLAWAIPDGHVSGPVDQADFQQAASGGFGLILVQLDDGRVLVRDVIPGSPADDEGIQPRAEILEFAGLAIEKALEETVLWTGPFSTDHRRRLEQLRFVQRAPVNTVLSITYRNPGSESAVERTLRADIDAASFAATAPNLGLTGAELPVEFELLDNGYGLITVYSFSDDLPLMIALWERAIERANLLDLPGLVIDMRQNGGGSGYLADQLPAYFFDEPLVIGNTARYSDSRDDFVVLPEFEDRLILPTNSLRYDGPVVVLISPNCASACEGFAHAMTLDRRAEIVGHYPTAGLGGSVVPIAMPSGVGFNYTNTRSLDADGNIHIEGLGIAPTVRVPVTEATVFADEDVLLDAAIDVLTGALVRYDVVQMGTLTPGNRFEVPVEVGQRLRYNLNVRAGQTISVYVQAAGVLPLPTVLRVYEPGTDALLLENAGLPDANGASGFESLAVPSDATLVLEIGTANDSIAGTLSVRVEETSSD